MSVVTMHPRLTPAQARFARWLEESMPFLMGLFDFDQAVYLPERVEQYLGTASHGQAIMARFALGVWRHDNQFDFDFIEAARVLDPEHLQCIADWMAEPFWP
jgi:hypothetical protein